MSSNSSNRRQTLTRTLSAGLAAAAIAVIAITGLSAQATAPYESPQAEELVFQATSVAAGAGKPASFVDSRLAQLEEISRRDGIEAARRFAATNRIKLDNEGRALVLIHQGAEAEFGGAPRTAFEPEQRIGRTTPGGTLTTPATSMTACSTVSCCMRTG